MKKLLSITLIICLLLAAFAGCGQKAEEPAAPAAQGNTAPAKQDNAAPASSAEPAAPARDDVTVWNSNAIDNYNPIDWYTTVQTPLFGNVYSSLVKIVYSEDGTAECVGDLAESWEYDESSTSWVFDLREDAMFTNGDPVTAEDVKFSFESVMASSYGNWKTVDIKSIEVRDEHTVAINTGEFSVRIPMVWEEVPVVDASAYQADQEGYIKEQIGSGPYKLDSLEEETGNFVLVRNDDYYGEAPAIKTVNVKAIADNNSAVIALQNGEVDYMYVTGINYDLVLGDDRIETKQQPSGYGTWLLLNSSAEPLTNKYLRQAIGYAVNYDAMAGLSYGGHVAEKNPTLPYCAPADSFPEVLNRYHYDVEKAKELIAQSGLSTPIDLGELYGGAGGKAELIQQNLAAVGINCEIVSLEPYAMVSAYIGGNYTIGIMGGIGGGQIRAAGSLASNYSTGGGNNLEHYSDPQVDELIKKLDKTTDKAEYDKLTEEILNIIADAAPVYNLGTGAYYSAYTKGLKVPVCNTGLVRFSDLSW